MHGFHLAFTWLFQTECHITPFNINNNPTILVVPKSSETLAQEHTSI